MLSVSCCILDRDDGVPPTIMGLEPHPNSRSPLALPSPPLLVFLLPEGGLVVGREQGHLSQLYESCGVSVTTAD